MRAGFLHSFRARVSFVLTRALQFDGVPRLFGCPVVQVLATEITPDAFVTEFAATIDPRNEILKYGGSLFPPFPPLFPPFPFFPFSFLLFFLFPLFPPLFFFLLFFPLGWVRFYPTLRGYGGSRGFREDR